MTKKFSLLNNTEYYVGMETYYNEALDILFDSPEKQWTITLGAGQFNDLGELTNNDFFITFVVCEFS